MYPTALKASSYVRDTVNPCKLGVHFFVTEAKGSDTNLTPHLCLYSLLFQSEVSMKNVDTKTPKTENGLVKVFLGEESTMLIWVHLNLEPYS